MKVRKGSLIDKMFSIIATPILILRVPLSNLSNKIQFKMCKADSYKSFNLVYYNYSDSDNFMKITKQALDLIQNYDQRRYKRIEENLKTIAYIKKGVTYYDPYVKTCFVHNLPEYTSYLAATIVHEATHAYLFNKYFPYSKRIKMVHEKIATQEHNRFMKKMIMLTPGLSEEEKNEKIAKLDQHFQKLMQTKWWDAKKIKEKRSEYMKKLKQGGRG